MAIRPLFHKPPPCSPFIAELSNRSQKRPRKGTATHEIQMTRFLPTLPHLLSSPGRPFIHRDLSGLQFNERVLAEARSSANPLLERLKFFAITASNLDEFFMIRYAALDRSIRLQQNRRAARHLLETRNTLLDMVTTLAAKQSETLDLLASALEPKGLELVRRPPVESEAFRVGQDLFSREILPHLSPPEPFRPHRLKFFGKLEMRPGFPPGLWITVSRRLAPVYIVAPENGPCRLFFLRRPIASPCGTRLSASGPTGGPSFDARRRYPRGNIGGRPVFGA
jgi:hypothetical protein